MIDIINILTTSAIALVSALGGSTLLYIKQEKRNKELQNEITAISEWKELYAELKTENKALDAKVDELYAKIEAHRDAKAKLHETIAENAEEIGKLNTQLAELKVWRCEVKRCAKRVPPSHPTMID